MHRKQHGMTIIGFLVAAVIAGLIIFAALRLVPVYLEHMKIVSVLESVKSEHGGNQPTVGAIRLSIERRLDVEDIRVVGRGDFKISSIGGGHRVQIAYDHVVPYVGNVWLLVRFDDSVEISN